MIDEEQELRCHVQHLLHDYSLAHYTTDHIAFTVNVVAEFLQQLELVPITNPASILIPIDPFATFSQMHQLDSIPRYDEIPQTTTEACDYIKRTLRTRPGKLKSERIVEDDNYSLAPTRPMSPVLTSRARRETPTLGKGKAARSLPSSYKNVLEKHKLAEIPVQPVEEIIIPIEETLNVTWKLNPVEHTAVLSLLKKTADMNRHQKGYKNPYLDPLQWKELPISFESPEPPFIPMFPRSRLPRSGNVVDRSAYDLKNMSDLPSLIINNAKIEEQDDLSKQNMMVVDGWQTLTSSPPSSIPTPRSTQEDDQLDQLFLPSSPDTEPPLVEQLEDAKIEITQMPRSRRIGGMGGLTKHVAAGKTMSSFLLPLLSHNSCEPPVKTPPHSPEPATSLIGQPPSATGNSNKKEPDVNDDLDTELGRLCKNENPADLIMNEKLDDKDGIMMDVPSLPEPNLHPPNELILPASLSNLAFAIKRPDGSKTTFPHPLKKAKGCQSLMLALSWIPFTVDKKPPTIPELIHVDSLFEESEPPPQDVDTWFDRALITDSDPQDTSAKFWNRFTSRSERYQPPEFESGLNMMLNRTERRRLARIQGNETNAMDVCDDNDNQVQEDSEEVQESSDFETLIKRPHKRARLEISSGPSLTQNHYRPAHDSDDSVPKHCSPSSNGLSQPVLDDKENWPPSSEPLFDHPDDRDYPQYKNFDQTPPPPMLMDVTPDFGETQANKTVTAGYPTSRHLRIEDEHNPSQGLDATIAAVEKLEVPAPKAAPPLNFEPQIATHALGIASFAQLRARKILAPVPTPEPIDAVPRNVLPERLEPRSAPSDIYDRNTIRLPEIPRPPATTIHRYMMSLELLQKQTLVRALRSPACAVDLVERDIMNGVDLILDPSTAIIFVPLLTLPSQCESVIQQVSYQSWHYSRLLVIFEAYPESSSVRPSKGTKSDLYAYTPPVLKAIKRFRRDVDIAEACGTKSPALKIQYAFADQVEEAALFARLFGDEAERRDQTRGAIWGKREWLNEIPEDELALAWVNGMNRFSASIILYQITSQSFLDMSDEERIGKFSHFLGIGALESFNADIMARYRTLEMIVSSPTDHNSDDLYLLP